MTGFLEIPLALIFGAGFVTLLSPCGYVLLPVYISYFLGGKMTLMGALRGASMSVLGIFIVFGAAGLMVGLASSLVQSVTPYLVLTAGIIILAIGVSKAFKINLPIARMPFRLGENFKPSGFFTYGIVYAFTGSGCTFPIFFAVLLYASLVPGLGAVITMFTYASGVAIPLVTTAILASKVNQLVFTRVAHILPKVHRATGFVLIAAGVYLVYYWYTNFLAPTL